MPAARVSRIVVVAVIALFSGGCAGWQTTSVAPRELLATEGIHSVRVTRHDKTRVEIYNPVLKGDSIIGHPTDRAIARLVMPLSQVNTIATRHTSLSRTLLVGIGALGTVFLWDLLQSLNKGQ